MNKGIIYFSLAIILIIGGAVLIWQNLAPVGQVGGSKEADKKDLVQLAKYQNISAEQLNAMLKRKDFTLVDVHIPEQPHIPGTDKFIPFDRILDRLDELPSDKNAKIVLYCRSGSMSRRAASDLLKAGYKNVYNLDGGVIEWTAAGYSLDNKKM